MQSQLGMPLLPLDLVVLLLPYLIHVALVLLSLLLLNSYRIHRPEVRYFRLVFFHRYQ